MARMRARLHVPLIVIAGAGAAPARASNGRADLTPARRVLEEAIADHAFPGCAVAVGTRKGVIRKEGTGSFDYESGPAVTTRRLYDLASLTQRDNGKIAQVRRRLTDAVVLCLEGKPWRL